MPENLGRRINTESREYDPFIAPDESYLIFASERPGGLGAADLYISFREAGGAWGDPKNMGTAVNSSAADYTPMLSPDGKYLFFTSSRQAQDDIYWIDARVIDTFRPADPLPDRFRAVDSLLSSAIPEIGTGCGLVAWRDGKVLYEKNSAHSVSWIPCRSRRPRNG